MSHLLKCAWSLQSADAPGLFQLKKNHSFSNNLCVYCMTAPCCSLRNTIRRTHPFQVELLSSWTRYTQSQSQGDSGIQLHHWAANVLSLLCCLGPCLLQSAGSSSCPGDVIRDPIQEWASDSSQHHQPVWQHLGADLGLQSREKLRLVQKYF